MKRTPVVCPATESVERAGGKPAERDDRVQTVPRRLRFGTLWALSAILLAALAAPPARAVLVRASVTGEGKEGKGPTVEAYRYPSVSADGRYVAFESNAPDLVPDDTNNAYDVFVKDLLTGELRRVSVSASGGEGKDASAFPSLSADGRLVAFLSRANNLVENDFNLDDVFVKDLQTGAIRRVSESATGEPGLFSSVFPALSADGKFVAFESSASNLVPGYNPFFKQIYVKDLATGEVRIASLSASGEPGGNFCNFPSVSADGRYVAFDSTARNLVPGDTNEASDVFVKDMQTGSIVRASVSATGEQTQGFSVSSTTATLSADGQLVAFVSNAANLVPGDTNEAPDVFVKNLQTGAVRRANVSASGGQTGFLEASGDPFLSGNGRFVAFASSSGGLVPGDLNNKPDVFVKDLQTEAVRLVSISDIGVPANDQSDFPALTPDGQSIVFRSLASNLVPNDMNTFPDIFFSGPLPKRQLGDVNGDAQVDVADAVLVLRFVVQIGAPTDVQTTAGDVNKDLSLSVEDAVLILRHIVFGEPLE